MIAIEDIAAILLCAGQSRRFGPGDKLMQDRGGKPLLASVLDGTANLPFAARFAVVTDEDSSAARLASAQGWALAVNAGGTGGRAGSVRVGLAHARSTRATSVLLLLGDMPNVDAGHVERLAAAATPERPALSAASASTGPPWIAALAWLDALEPTLLLRDSLHAVAVRVAAQHNTLRDFDTRADFEV